MLLLISLFSSQLEKQEVVGKDFLCLQTSGKKISIAKTFL